MQGLPSLKSFINWIKRWLIIHKTWSKCVYRHRFFSIINLIVKIWSTRPLMFLSPQCSSLKTLSIASLILKDIVLLSNLLPIETRLIPLQLLYWLFTFDTYPLLKEHWRLRCIKLENKPVPSVRIKTISLRSVENRWRVTEYIGII